MFLSQSFSVAPCLQPLDQIGVGDERLAEGDEIGRVRVQHLGGEIEVVAVVGDVGAGEALAQARIVERGDVARTAGGAFDDVEIDELQRAEAVDDMVEQGLRVRIRDVVGRRHRRDADAGAIGAGLRCDGPGDFQHQPRAVLDRAAIGIGALVGAVLGELLEQIAVGAVDLDAVEAGFERILRGALEIVDDAWNFGELERTGLGDVGEAAVDEGLALGADRARRHRGCAIGLKIDVRDAADMPELDEDLAAALMHLIGDLAPAGDLVLGVDAGRVLVALALLRDLACFGDQKPCGGTLGVIVGGKRARYEGAGNGAVARQRRHHETVRQRDRAELVGLKQFGRTAHENASRR